MNLPAKDCIMWNNQENLANEGEPEALRGLSKAKLYELVSRDYYLPNKECRCVSRGYLVSVHEGTVWRIRHTDLLQFELDLSIEEKIKSSFFNIGVLKDKANALLRLLNQREFGFPPILNPEETWFCRVLRKIDVWNVLRGFKCRVRGVPRPNILPVRMYKEVYSGY